MIRSIAGAAAPGARRCRPNSSSRVAASDGSFAPKAANPSAFRVQQMLPSGREAAGRIHHRQPWQERRLRRHRPQSAERFGPADAPARRAEGARAGFLAARGTSSGAIGPCSTLRARRSRWCAPRTCGSSRPMSRRRARWGSLPGAEFLPDLSARDRKALDAALDLRRGRRAARPTSPCTSPDGAQWGLRASIVTNDSDAFYLMQMSALGAAPAQTAEAFNLDQILHRLPDAFVIVDKRRRAPQGQPDLSRSAQVGVESAVSARTWDAGCLFPARISRSSSRLVQRHGSVRAFRCRLEGELGSVTEVEISAVGDRAPNAQHIGLLIRDVTSRGAAAGAPARLISASLRSAISRRANSLETVVASRGGGDRAPLHRGSARQIPGQPHPGGAPPGLEPADPAR